MPETSNVTAYQAKKLLAEFLTENGATEITLKARTIDFTDLAGATCVFVCIDHFQLDADPNQRHLLYREARGFARQNGFRISSVNPIIP